MRVITAIRNFKAFRRTRNILNALKRRDSLPVPRLDALKLEWLEDRTTPSIVADEQLFVYLLNRARNNPVQYQVENSLPVNLAGVQARPPLAINTQLVNSAGFRAEEMAAFNYFSHQSQVTGKFPNQIVREAGYPLPSLFINNANYVESIAAGFNDARTTLNALIVDEGVPDVGHRVHLLGTIDFFANHREVGVGLGINNNSTYKKYWSVNTAYQNTSDRFLTGVIFNDANGNQRYDLNEGLGGVTVMVGTTIATTNAAGGWSMKVGTGSHVVRAFGGGFQGVSVASVSAGSSNVEVDFISGDAVGFTNFSRATLPNQFQMSFGSDILGRLGGQWWAAESTASGFSNRYMGAWSTEVNWVDVRSGDFTGNGLTDVVGRDAANGQWWMARATSSGFQMQLWGAWSPGVVWSSVFAADVNGDGRTDLIGRELTSGVWYVGISTGSSFNTVAFGAFSPMTNWVDMVVGDFNGDGLADVAGRSSATGDWYAGLSTGSSFVTAYYGRWSSAVIWQDVKVGDFNGDGRADIVGRIATTGEIWVGRSSGFGFSNLRFGAWSPFAGWVDVNVGDFNGDGKSDIIGRVPTTGEWYVGLANAAGNGFNTALWSVWAPGVSWLDVRVIDANRDGRTDIVGRVEADGSWYAGISNGSTFATRFNGIWTAATWSDVRVGRFGATTANRSASGGGIGSNSSGGSYSFSAIDAFMANWDADSGDGEA